VWMQAMSTTRLPRDVLLAQRLPRVAERVDECPKVQQVLHLDRLIPVCAQVEACRESTERLLDELKSSDGVSMKGEIITNDVAIKASPSVFESYTQTDEADGSFTITATELEDALQRVRDMVTAKLQAMNEELSQLRAFRDAKMGDTITAAGARGSSEREISAVTEVEAASPCCLEVPPSPPAFLGTSEKTATGSDRGKEGVAGLCRGPQVWPYFVDVCDLRCLSEVGPSQRAAALHLIAELQDEEVADLEEREYQTWLDAG